MAEATAREIGRVSLDDALELTALIARDDERRRGRAAARWLLRYLEEAEAPTIADAQLAAACLAALGGRHHDEALATLRAITAAPR